MVGDNYFSNRAEVFFIKLMSELSHNWPQQNINTLEGVRYRWPTPAKGSGCQGDRQLTQARGARCQGDRNISPARGTGCQDGS